MATTIRGTAILKWGTNAVTGYIVNESEVTAEGGSEMIDNEDGQYVTHITNFALKDVTSLVFIPLSGTAVPAIDAVITYNSITRPIISRSRVNSKRAAEIWRLNLEGIAGVTYT